MKIVLTGFIVWSVLNPLPTDANHTDSINTAYPTLGDCQQAMDDYLDSNYAFSHRTIQGESKVVLIQRGDLECVSKNNDDQIIDTFLKTHWTNPN